MAKPDQPFGWRKRIGLLSPTVIETAAYDFYKLAPDGVTMCATTSNIDHWNKDNFKEHVLDANLCALSCPTPRAAAAICSLGCLARSCPRFEASRWWWITSPAPVA